MTSPTPISPAEAIRLRDMGKTNSEIRRILHIGPDRLQQLFDEHDAKRRGAKLTPAPYARGYRVWWGKWW